MHLLVTPCDLLVLRPEMFEYLVYLIVDGVVFQLFVDVLQVAVWNHVTGQRR